MQAEVPGEVLINLHNLRPDLRPKAQTGSTIPKIIERNSHAGRPDIVDDTRQTLHVGHAFIFFSYCCLLMEKFGVIHLLLQILQTLTGQFLL